MQGAVRVHIIRSFLLMMNLVKKPQAEPDSRVSENIPQFLVLTVMLLAVEKHHKKKEGVMQLFGSPPHHNNVMFEDISDEY